MTTSEAKLSIRSDRCNRCGRCTRACPRALIRVTSGYVHVDTSACTTCFACADVCQTGALTRGRLPVRPGPSQVLSASDLPTVVVGSRAEAKALRKAAATAERSQHHAVKAQQRRTQVLESADQILACAEADGTAVWSVTDAVTIVGVLVVSIAAKEAVLASAVIAMMPDSGQIIARALASGAFYAVQLVALGFLASRHGMGFSQAFGLGRLGRSWAHRAGTAALVAGLFVVTRALGLLWGALAQRAGWEPPVRTELTAVFGAGSLGLLLTVAMVVVATPFVEELVFRGVVMRAMGCRWGKAVAIVGSAAVFAASHLSPWSFVPLMALGIAAGWLAWERASLWPAIALHALYNGIVVAAAFWVAAG